tara:strand:+ start:1046 stop:1159 length:114 start_codon:yes stop_codon:yes gene_type:complete
MAANKRQKTVKVRAYKRIRNGIIEFVRKHMRRPPLGK